MQCCYSYQRNLLWQTFRNKIPLHYTSRQPLGRGREALSVNNAFARPAHTDDLQIGATSVICSVQFYASDLRHPRGLCVALSVERIVICREQHDAAASYMTATSLANSSRTAVYCKHWQLCSCFTKLSPLTPALLSVPFPTCPTTSNDTSELTFLFFLKRKLTEMLSLQHSF